jgi:hypothetical protein
MRYAIHQQIFDFKNKTTLVCEICDSTDTIEIDHHTIPFRTLFKNFTDGKVLPTIFNNTYYNSACFRDEDHLFRCEWESYHKNNASLRPLCKKCNMTHR